MTEPAREVFVYDAFISYRRVDRDAKWADWLIDALERYRVPLALQKRGLPDRLRKIFRDENEVSASTDIDHQIKEALAASRFLIVICSAFTPRSRWVQREIEIFTELGRGDQVLALWTEGEADDAFPEHMLERCRRAIGPDGAVHSVKEHIEPLAADVRPRPGISKTRQKRLALLRLVAPILGVQFDDLQQRDRERVRNRRLAWTSVAAGFILLAAGSGFGYWELGRPKTTYYNFMVWRWGAPQGLDQLDEEARSHVSDSYRFVTHRGKVVDVRREGSGGALKEDDSGQAHWVVTYRADGHLNRIQYFDNNDLLIREEYFERGSKSQTLIVSFKRDNVDFALANSVTPLGADGKSRADITRKELTLNEQGYTIESRYQNNYGVPQHDASGSYGQNYARSPEGLLLRVAQVGSDGKEITAKNGVRAEIHKYDSRYNRERTTLIGSDGKPFDGPDGFAYYLCEYDRWGNIVGMEYYSVSGVRVVSTYGIWRITLTYDDRGNEIERAYYGTDGELTTSILGNAIVRTKYDDRGKKIEEAYLDVYRKPALNRDGIAKTKYRYDDRSREIEVGFFGLRDEPTFGAFPAAAVQRDRDSQGNIVEHRFLGLYREPILHTESKVAKIKQSFNDRGQLTHVSFFDVDDRPTLSKDGIASQTLTYDQRGNVIEAAFFGIEGKPVSGHLHCARVRHAYDASGMAMYHECLGVDGNLAVSSIGYAHVRWTFDQRGNLKKAAFFGASKEPILVEGAAVTLMDYDARGNMVLRSFLGTDGKPAADFKGISTRIYRYNPRGEVARIDNLGLDGEPTLGTIGCSSEQQEFDIRGRLVETICLGFGGGVVNRKDGHAKATFGYDARGNLVEAARFDAEGKPPISSRSGIWKMTYTYDNRNVRIGAVYFDNLGQEIPVDVIFDAVDPGSTAERIGLMPGDRILSYDGSKPTSEDQLNSSLNDFSGRGSRILIVRRGAQPLTFKVAPGPLGASLDVVRAEVDVIDTLHVRKN